MSLAHEIAIPADGSVKLAIVAPDGRAAMVSHARSLAELRRRYAVAYGHAF